MFKTQENKNLNIINRSSQFCIMTKIQPHSNTWENVNIPYSFIRKSLCMFGALPLTRRKPHTPSRDLKDSTFLYCVAFYGLTLCSVYACVMQCLRNMKEAYPYDHAIYTLSFEIIIWCFSNILTIVLWTDVGKFSSTLEAWCRFTVKYKAVMKKAIPSYSRREKLIGTAIVISCFSNWLMAHIAFGEKLLSYNSVLAGAVPSIVQMSLTYHWIGLNTTLSLAADDQQKHLKECIECHTCTLKLVEDYRDLWRLLRNIADKMNNMKAPLFFFGVQCFIVTMYIFESTLYYLAYGDKLSYACHVVGMLAFAGPICILCGTSQTAVYKVLMLYFLKETRKPRLSLNGFAVIDKPLLLTAVSTMLTYVLVLAQFHQMKMSEVQLQ